MQTEPVRPSGLKEVSVTIAEASSDAVGLRRALFKEGAATYSFVCRSPQELPPEELLQSYRRFSPASLQWQLSSRASSSDLVEGPLVSSLWTALLLVDVSGYTKMCAKAGAELARHHTNTFFTGIIEEIVQHGGDVLKFLGDAMMVAWPVPLDASHEARVHAVREASTCAAQVMSRRGHYRAPLAPWPSEIEKLSSEAPLEVELTLHCGLVCGHGYLFDVGDSRRREVLIGGSLVAELGETESEAQSGEVVISAEVAAMLPVSATKQLASGHYRLLKDWCLADSTDSEHGHGACSSSCSPTSHTFQGALERRGVCRIQQLWRAVQPCFQGLLVPLRRTLGDALANGHRYEPPRRKAPPVVPLPPRATGHAEGILGKHLALQFPRLSLDRSASEGGPRRSPDRHPTPEAMEAHERSRKCLAAHVPNACRFYVEDDSVSVLEALGEMRNVTTLFVAMDGLLPALNTGEVEPVQRAFTALCESARKFGGEIRQFVLDDKGCVGICAWGLPHTSHVDDPARAVKCALNLLDTLKRFNNLEPGPHIGIATGEVYVGLIGTLQRCEYAMVGPSVNLAARLMSKADCWQVLVDESVKKVVEEVDGLEDFSFELIGPVPAKGYSLPVIVYEPGRLSAGDLGPLTPFSRATRMPSKEASRAVFLERWDMVDHEVQLIGRLASVLAHGGEGGKAEFSLRTLVHIMERLGYEPHAGRSVLSRALRAVVQLRASNILRATRGGYRGDPLYTFVSKELQETVYQLLPSGERAEIHGHYADWIMMEVHSSGASTPGSHSPQVASVLTAAVSAFKTSRREKKVEDVQEHEVPHVKIELSPKLARLALLHHDLEGHLRQHIHRARGRLKK